MKNGNSAPSKAIQKPFYAQSRFLIIALVLGVVYSYGWRVTEIDLAGLARDFHLIKPLVRDLLKPDLFTANKDSLAVETGFNLSRHPDTTSPPPTPENNLPRLFLSQTSGNIGDRIQVRGAHLPANKSGSLFWVNSIGQEYPLGDIETNAEGKFDRNITVPGMARGKEQTIRVRITWNTGGFRISDTLKLTLEKMLETVFLALMATTLAIFVAVPLCFLGARNLMTQHLPGTLVYYIVRTVFNVIRSMEPLILAILFAIWVGIGPFAGTLALGLHSIAALGKLFSEQIESIDTGPVEAVTATGANRLQVILYAVIPQVLPQFLALAFYRWDINVRMSTIIGFVGGGGIGFLLSQWINLLKYHEAGTALLAIAAVVITLDLVSAKIREKIIG